VEYFAVFYQSNSYFRLSGEMKKSAVALPIGPQHCINQVQAAQKTSKPL